MQSAGTKLQHNRSIKSELQSLPQIVALLNSTANTLQNFHNTPEASVSSRTESLHALSQQLLKARDEERRSVARDLHDSTGQTLSALKMAVDKIRTRFKGDKVTFDELTDISGIVDQALQEIRTTSYLLHPPLLDELGLSSAASWFVEGFSKRSGIQVNVDFPHSKERLPRDIEMVLFRILQESLTNVHRHAGASVVNIVLERQEHAVHLSVEDNGHGMPPGLLKRVRNATSHSGVGLAGIRERIRDLNGELDVTSTSKGTSLRVTVPLFKSEKTSKILVAVKRNTSRLTGSL